MAELPDGTPHSRPSDHTRSKLPSVPSPFGAVGERMSSAMRSTLGNISKAKVEPKEDQGMEHIMVANTVKNENGTTARTEPVGAESMHVTSPKITRFAAQLQL